MCFENGLTQNLLSDRALALILDFDNRQTNKFNVQNYSSEDLSSASVNNAIVSKVLVNKAIPKF